jgi:hypothetical protein
VQQLMEWVVGQTEVLGENQPQCRFVHHESHATGAWKPATNSLWEAGSRSASQEILAFYGIQMFITSVTWERQWSLLWAIISRLTCYVRKR